MRSGAAAAAGYSFCGRGGDMPDPQGEQGCVGVVAPLMAHRIRTLVLCLPRPLLVALLTNRDLLTALYVARNRRVIHDDPPHPGYRRVWGRVEKGITGQFC